MDQSDQLDQRHLWLYATVALTGLCVMGAELAAGRLVAPYYGTSTFVWSAIIGAVLGSMAVGQVLGGRLSRTDRPGRALLWVLLAATGALLMLPVAGPPLMSGTLEWFTGGRYEILVASVLGVTSLIAVPLLALGACNPLLMHLILDQSDHVGSVSSRVYAANTFGSLVGTYLTGLLLIPWLGTTATIYLLAGILCGLALLGALVGGMLDAKLLAFTLAAWLPAAGLLVDNDPADGQTVVERETAHNHVEIIDGRYQRKMVFNDGYAKQSVLPHNRGLSLHGIWGQFATAPAFRTEASASGRVLMLGLGGGTAARNWRGLYPNWSIVGVEIDGEVLELGRRYMDMPEEIETHAADGRSFLHYDDRRYDVVIVDAFEFPYIPFHLTTREFFEQVRDHLRPGGAVVLNVGRDGKRDQLVHAIGRTLTTVFDHLQRADVANRSNAFLVATDHAPDRMVGLEALELDRAAHRHLEKLNAPTPFRPDPNAPLLTDDRAPVEWITDLTLIKHVLNDS